MLPENSIVILVIGAIFLLIVIGIKRSINKSNREQQEEMERAQREEDQKRFSEEFQDPPANEVPQEVADGKPTAFISMATAFTLVARPMVNRLPCMLELDLSQKPTACPAFGNSAKVISSECKECRFHKMHAQDAVALWLDSLGKLDLLHRDVESIAKLVTDDIKYLTKRVSLDVGAVKIDDLNRLKWDWTQNLFNRDAYSKVISISPYYFGDKSGLDADLETVAQLKRQYMERLETEGSFEKSRAFFIPKLVDVLNRLEDLLTKHKADTDSSLITDLDLDGLTFAGIPNWDTEKIFAMVQRFHQLPPEEKEELTPVVNEILQAAFLYPRHSMGNLDEGREKVLKDNFFYKNLVSGDEQ